MEYSANTVNPATARARFRESLDIILKCWTDDGPQSYAGDFYSYRYLNPWPKPLQQPYPKCYIVGTGSPETIELAAELGFGYSVVFIPTEVQLRGVRPVPRAARGARPRRDTRQGDDRDLRLRRRERRRPRSRSSCRTSCTSSRTPCAPRRATSCPPGYVTVPEFRKRVQAPDVHGAANWDDLVAINRIVAGTPEQVADAVGGWIEAAGTNRVEPEPHDRRHAELEGREEHDPVRGRGHPAPAQEGGRSVSTVTFDKLTFDVEGTEHRRARCRQPRRAAARLLSRWRHVPRMGVRGAVDLLVPRPHPVPPRLR